MMTPREKAKTEKACKVLCGMALGTTRKVGHWELLDMWGSEWVVIAIRTKTYDETHPKRIRMRKGK